MRSKSIGTPKGLKGGGGPLCCGIKTRRSRQPWLSLDGDQSRAGFQLRLQKVSYKTRERIAEDWQDPSCYIGCRLHEEQQTGGPTSS